MSWSAADLRARSVSRSVVSVHGLTVFTRGYWDGGGGYSGGYSSGTNVQSTATPTPPPISQRTPPPPPPGPPLSPRVCAPIGLGSLFVSVGGVASGAIATAIAVPAAALSIIALFCQ